jgi:predicted nucleic acid-binding protein
MSSPTYSKTQPFTVAELVHLLQTFTAAHKHAFWPDSLSILDPSRFDHSRILSSKHLTDIYLLSLAVEKSGRLVTFDEGATASAVARALPKHLLIL